jgi:hypothetical protein
LLDTCQAERHPVAARALRSTMAQTALARSDARIDALRDTMAELLSMDEPRRRFADPGLPDALTTRFGPPAAVAAARRATSAATPATTGQAAEGCADH